MKRGIRGALSESGVHERSHRLAEPMGDGDDACMRGVGGVKSHGPARTGLGMAAAGRHERVGERVGHESRRPLEALSRPCCKESGCRAQVRDRGQKTGRSERCDECECARRSSWAHRYRHRPTKLSVRDRGEHQLSTRPGPAHHTLFGLAHQAKQTAVGPTAVTHPQRAPSSEAETTTAGPVRAPQLRLRAPSSQAPTPGTQIPSHRSEDSYALVSSGPASTTGAKPKGQEEDDVDEDGEGEDDDDDESGDSDWE
ncbi:hypothetical protein FA95DRAFT_956593 [Auriscalpium vulgare]|uniref:Uncharacterized protein n=1 Tax=Auriscalpium vulgare TaxID=40419 RepID=A0ACB8R735_9AGAM|nr:hypothetical protein FA95DRAFT_956593 [Auriscalpium vulgare]